MDTTGDILVLGVCFFPRKPAAGPVPHELRLLRRLQWVFLSTTPLNGKWAHCYWSTCTHTSLTTPNTLSTYSKSLGDDGVPSHVCSAPHVGPSLLQFTNRSKAQRLEHDQLIRPANAALRQT